LNRGNILSLRLSHSLLVSLRSLFFPFAGRSPFSRRAHIHLLCRSRVCSLARIISDDTPAKKRPRNATGSRDLHVQFFTGEKRKERLSFVHVAAVAAAHSSGNK
jgi:hypothetical protein